MRLIIITASLGTAAMLAGCYSTLTSPVGLATGSEQAIKCVRSKEPGKAPQYMTYDAKTGTETHTSTSKDGYSFTALNRADATGVGVKNKDDIHRRPEVCRED